MSWARYEGNYDKQFYAIRLRAGRVVDHCWPNAGSFHCLNGGEYIEGQEVAEFKRCECGHELGGCTPSTSSAPCVACEGKPLHPNDPCAVCGRASVEAGAAL